MPDGRRGDFSRLGYAPHKHFSAVLMQQGRVHLDSDWNELVEIIADRFRTDCLDLIGPAGAPYEGGGFELRSRVVLSFDGHTQYLTLGHAPSIAYAAPAFGVEALITPCPWQDRQVILSRYEKPGKQAELRHAYSLEMGADSRLRLRLSPGPITYLESAEPLREGQPVHVAFTHDANHGALFVDGHEVAVAGTGYVPAAFGSFLLVGVESAEQRRLTGFRGDLHELRLCNRWLEPTSAAARNRLAPGPSADQVLGHWRFDEIHDGLVLDRSGCGHHALLGGGRTEHWPSRRWSDFTLSKGRCYVGGLRCELQEDVSVAAQPDFPGGKVPEHREPGCTYLCYLEARERYLSAAQDPTLREPALGGSDTTGRAQVVTQVKWLGIDEPVSEDSDPLALAAWAELSSRTQARARLRARRRPDASPGMENRLYRVEVHQDTQIGHSASFKWSRDNASYELSVIELQPGGRGVSVARPGVQDLELAPGDWVELVDESSELCAMPGTLARVESASANDNTVQLDRPVSFGSGEARSPAAVLRRWDHVHREGTDVDGALRVEEEQWVELEHGIEVCFESSDALQGGDYWLFVAREHDRNIEWPTDAAGQPQALVPLGIARHLCPLALVRFEQSDDLWIKDCRPLFQSATRGAVSKAGDRMHGRLEISPTDAGQAGLRVHGSIEAATLIGKLGSPATVDSVNLRDHSVTRSKVAPDVGIVPVGYCILGATADAPAGYEYTGNHLVVPSNVPRWVQRLEVSVPEQPMELRSAVIDNQVYTVSDTGHVWRFDAVTGELSEARSLPNARLGLALVAINGQLLVFGGISPDGRHLVEVLSYDPRHDTWEPRAPIPEGRSYASAVAVEDRVHLIGGLERRLWVEIASRRNEVYDLRTDSWNRHQPMPAARYAMTVLPDAESVHLFGGERRWFFNWLGRRLSNKHEEYWPDAQQWIDRPSVMVVPRAGGGAVTVGERGFIVGGRSLFGHTAEVSEYHFGADRWARNAAIPNVSTFPGLAEVAGRLIVHVPASVPGALLVLECPVAVSWFVHRKRATIAGDIEAQLRVDVSC